MYRRALAVSAVAIALSTVAMSPMFAAASAATPSIVTIAQVQGSGATTPLFGQTVTVHGVVTAVLPGLGGVYLQSASSSGIAGASDGIFVAMRESSFSVGDLVGVTGEAGEKASQTQIVATSVSVIQAAAGLPAATPLPDSVVGAARESYEGMLVTPSGPYYLDSIDNREGSLVLSAGSKTADAATRLILDDGTAGVVTTQPFLGADTVIRPGDTLVAPQKALVLGAGASGYRLEPTIPLVASSDLSYKPKFTAASPRLGDAPVLAP